MKRLSDLTWKDLPALLSLLLILLAAIYILSWYR
jgi:hypothetical protein